MPFVSLASFHQIRIGVAKGASLTLYMRPQQILLTAIFDDGVALEALPCSVVVESATTGAVTTDYELLTAAASLLRGRIHIVTLWTAPHSTHS